MLLLLCAICCGEAIHSPIVDFKVRLVRVSVGRISRAMGSWKTINCLSLLPEHANACYVQKNANSKLTVNIKIPNKLAYDADKIVSRM
jgi:hypothetical protein